MKIKHKRLRFSTKITVLYSVIFSIIIVVFAAVFIFMTFFIRIKESYEEMESCSSSVEDYLSNLNSLKEIDGTRMNIGYNLFLSIYDENNRPVFTNKQEAVLLPVNIADFISLHRGRDGSLYAYLTRTVTIDNNLYYIQLTQNYDDQVQFIYTIIKAAVLLSLLGILLCYIFVRLLSRQILKPLRNITAIARDITAKNLDTRIPMDDTEDDLSRLTEVFNTMIGRLDMDFQKNRRFISDVSHELRTPLAVLLGYINMLNRWGKDNTDILNNSLLRLEAEAKKMDRLIDNLLILARSDNNALVLKKEEFRLSDLINEVIDEAKLIYETYTFRSCLENKNIKLIADYNAIKRVLRNLIDNSVKYSSPSDGIDIKAGINSGEICIIVSDSGIGISPQDLPYIFERFYRVDESRSQSTGGSGLGLSIAKNIVQNHNGSIHAESEPGKGTRIIVCFPVK